jgi:hypothetical protein
MKMDDFLTLDDLMVIAGVDGEPRAAYREDEVFGYQYAFPRRARR